MDIDPHYVEGFIKECYDRGLDEEQASFLLDRAIARQNPLVKQAAPFMKAIQGLKPALGVGLRGARDIALGGAAIGAAQNALGHDEGGYMGPLLGLGLGAASLLRGKPINRKLLQSPSRMGLLRGGINAQRKLMAGGMPGQMALKHTAPLMARGARPLAVGLGAGILGSRTSDTWGELGEGFDNMTLGYARNRLARAGVPTGGYADPDNIGVPWWAREGQGGGGDDLPENLWALPGHTQRAIRSGAGAGKPVAGPMRAAQDASNRLRELEDELAKLDPTGTTPREMEWIADKTTALEAEKARMQGQLRAAITQVREAERAGTEQRLAALGDAGRQEAALARRIADLQEGGRMRTGPFGLFSRPDAILRAKETATEDLRRRIEEGGMSAEDIAREAQNITQQGASSRAGKIEELQAALRRAAFQRNALQERGQASFMTPEMLELEKRYNDGI